MTDDIDLDAFQRSGPFPGDPNGDYPTLHDWQPLRSGSAIRLSGNVRNHPNLPDGEIITSPLRDIACDRSWCRTFNTLYLLGQQAAAKAVPDVEPLPLLLRLLLAEDWVSAAKIARDGTIPHRSLLDLQANSDFTEIWTNADAMSVLEGQRRAAAILDRIADGAMPYAVVNAWHALAANTSSPFTCVSTVAAGAAAYDRWYATRPKDETAQHLRRNLNGWRGLADDNRRPPSNLEPDQFKLARTLGEKTIREENGQNEDAVDGQATTLRKSAPAPEVRKPEPPRAQPGLVVIRGLGGNTLTVIGREVRNEFRKIIGATMPLVETPVLATARQTLVREFPHCDAAIDAILGDLKGRTIKWRPTLLVGSPGAGKSRLANRIPQVLGLPEPQRFDAAGSSDNAFGGTPRRWSSGEPSIPLEAVRRSGIANACVILEEAEKCGTSRVSGRFSDSVLPFLETTTSRVYPDPYIEAPCDLSQLNYLATANNELDLPAPLRDRFRLLRIPEPGPEHLSALSDTLLKEIAADRGISPAWATPLDGDEMEIATRLWPGGSIRRLRSVLEIIFSRRDERALTH